jgi:predicted anti-sigma-YlaC factor YlaD
VVNADWSGFADVDCPKRFELARYDAGDMEASEAETIRAHLDECQPCRCFVRELERRRRNFLEKHPAGDVVPKLLAEEEARARVGRFRRLWGMIRSWWSQRRSD